MTLLRRAPREVYHVYAEQEFLADTRCDEPLHTVGAAAGVQRLHRIAGATALVAAAGAVGGLIALTGLQSLTGGRRRERQRPPAAVTALSASTSATRPSVWREHPRRGRPGRVSVGHHAQPRLARVRRAAVRARARDVAPVSDGAPAPESAPVPESAPAPQSAPVDAAAPAGTARAVAAVAAAPRQPGVAEFGFER
jgi:hypothetical protein